MALITPERQRRLIDAARLRAQLSVEELCARYLALGGTADAAAVEAFLAGTRELSPGERDRLALAVNEELDSLAGQHRVPYSRTPRESEPDHGPLAALTVLLRDTHLAPPDAAPAATDAAARRLGVRTVIYLADYGSDHLVPMPGEHGHDRSSLSIDGTLAGRAFRLVRTQTAVAEGQARLWVPIIDGVERVGVLDVMVDDEDDLADPTLHRQCWWLAHYLGHVLTEMDTYGDALDTVRRTRPRTVQAELIWQLLPPLTAGTERVVVAGRIEPSHDMGGDVFDYALSPSTAQFAVFDATGHDLRAGMAAAAALAAYRNARRSGADLFQQAEAVHRAIVDEFGGETYATGVLAELDVHSGRLRYLAAGHPAPLLMRGGKVVKRLGGGRRPLLGLDVQSLALAEEHLQPGDTVVVYTDGITEARDEQRRQFGVERLSETLGRAAAEDMPLPEAARRVFKAILDHQQGVLQDDATLFLAHWPSQEETVLDPAPPLSPARPQVGRPGSSP